MKSNLPSAIAVSRGTISPALGQRSATGFAWMAGQTITVKLARMVGQLLLAWLLEPRDFGLIGLALMVIFFTGLLRLQNLSVILIHRRTSLRVWGNAAFWLSIGAGLVSTAVTIGIAPIAAWMCHQPPLTGLVLTLSIAAPFEAATAVPLAVLQLQLRFRLLAVLSGATQTGLMALTVVFAALGFGAYSFVWPRIIVAVAGLAVTLYIARPPIRWATQWKRWRFLLADSTHLVSADLWHVVMLQGDYLILGLLYSPVVVGVYFFAYNLSTQVLQLVTGNVSSVLLPALSNLQAEPQRLREAILRAGRAIAAIAVPLGLLQAALAAPAIRSVPFLVKWQGAIPALQILSLAAAIIATTRVADSVFKALGAFRLFAWLSFGGAVFFVLGVFLGAVYGAATGTAVAVSVVLTLHGIVSFAFSTRLVGGRSSALLGIFVPPLAAGAATIGLSGVLATYLPAMGRPWTQFALIGLGAAAYVPLLRVMAPATYHDILARTPGLVRLPAPLRRCLGVATIATPG